MTNTRRETRWLSLTFIISGSVTLAVGALAIALPEETLIPSMLAVGLIAVLSGLNQMLSAASMRSRVAVWRLLFAHGVLAFVFGALTVGATALTLSMAYLVVAAWLLAHSLLAVRLTSTTTSRGLRWALNVTAALDISGAILLLALPAVSIFQYLFFGASYAALFGASQLIAGLRLRHVRLDHVSAPTVDLTDWSSVTRRPRHSNS
jgi:uncharacterized membrane protein HdeD (DUF308 family)